MSTTSLRAYLRELRTVQGITQKELAAAMGVSFRTVLEWEVGRIDELKSVPLVRAVEYLKGSIGDVRLLLLDAQSTAEQGHALATQRFADLQQGIAPSSEQSPEHIHIVGRYLRASFDLVFQSPSPNVPLREGLRIYEGIRNERKSVASGIMVNGLSFAEAFTQAYGRAFPDIEWGYAGRGPERLAFVLLAYESDLATANQWAQRFYRDVTAKLPRELGGIEWRLHSDQIQQWLHIVLVLEAGLNQAQSNDATHG